MKRLAALVAVTAVDIGIAVLLLMTPAVAADGNTRSAGTAGSLLLCCGARSRTRW